MTPLPEFSRPERIDTIGAGDRTIIVEAVGAECAALAKRFGLVSIERLAGEFRVRREAAGIVARGRVTATVRQACVVTGEPIEVAVDEPVALRFVENLQPDGDEIELSDDDCDTMGFSGGAIDLGEAAAETMALALDQFPRGPRAAQVLRAAGVVSEDEVKPLGALAGLKAALERGQS